MQFLKKLLILKKEIVKTNDRINIFEKILKNHFPLIKGASGGITGSGGALDQDSELEVNGATFKLGQWVLM